MKIEPQTKYQPYSPISLPDRKWPDQTIKKAPIWCSVDLRDGNQALAIPMNIEEKLEMFQALVDIGFKEIEIGFPSASQIDFDFNRRLIEENLIPDDVWVQVLVPARDDLIPRTIESLKGAKNAIVHLYNSTSPVQRKVVFGKDKSEIIDIAVNGTRHIKSLLSELPETNVRFQYSPESFSSTEVEFSLEICEAVVDVWQPTPDNPIILNLPATVEIFTPNVHADQIEWFCRNIRDRESVTISLHTHNDRGTGIAATELGLMAGADRVEGTLFGNGERTGNLDIVTVALNMFSQGIHPQLNFSNLNDIREVYERCTRMRVPERQPYGGDLVFTAFSGSHQDAIKKGFKHCETKQDPLWEVPYLPIDPQDIGRNYNAVIRVNSQSGKGGVAYILEKEFGFQLPKDMAKEFGRVINKVADETGKEIQPLQIKEIFYEEYLKNLTPIELKTFRAESNLNGKDKTTCVAELIVDGKAQKIEDIGNGPIEAFSRGLCQNKLGCFEIQNYSEHSLGKGADAQAVSYIQIKTEEGKTFFGAGMDTNIGIASIKAVVSALNRSKK